MKNKRFTVVRITLSTLTFKPAFVIFLSAFFIIISIIIIIIILF